jgi:hypothetical protein
MNNEINECIEFDAKRMWMELLSDTCQPGKRQARGSAIGNLDLRRSKEKAGLLTGWVWRGSRQACRGKTSYRTGKLKNREQGN